MGHIESIVQTIVYVSGIPGARLNELVITESGQLGLVQAVTRDLVEVMMLSSERILPKTRVTRIGEGLKIPVSEGILGRVINPHGAALDGLGPITGESVFLPVHRSAPGIKERVKIKEQLETGVSLVDYLIPIGKGQRELIMGDHKTGRTTFLLQVATSQASYGTVCIYVGIGKRKSDIRGVENYLKKMGVMGSCVIIFTSSADPASLVYLAPFSGFTIAEFFRDQGREVLIMLDDLTTHAKFYREIALLSRRMPARESYPGDIFHLHAQLLERAGHVRRGEGSVSITALPVVETVQGDLTGYIPTNAMAMTDGHLFFDVNEFKKGRRPAVNVFLSVTRTGNQTQTGLERETRKTIIEILSRYQKALEIAHFGFDLPLKTRTELNLGERLEAVFDQQSFTIIDRPLAQFLLALVLSEFWSSKSIEQVRVERTKLIEAYRKGLLKLVSFSQISNLGQLKDLIKNKRQEIEKVLHSISPEKQKAPSLSQGAEVPKEVKVG